MPKYPEVTVNLVGRNGNAFLILSRVRKALKEANVPIEELDLFINEATSGDYNDLLATCMRWVNVT
jgi:hypothetical protein